jgi:hypothetical protein
MKHAFEMGSGAMIYIRSFMKIGSGIQKLTAEGIHKHRQHGELIDLLYFYQNKESRLKRIVISVVMYKHLFNRTVSLIKSAWNPLLVSF